MNELQTIQIENNSELGKMNGLVPIPGFENNYLINPNGNIVSPSKVDKKGALRNTRILKPHKTKNGYMRIGLTLKGKQKQYYVHRLVAITFLENPYGKLQINHLDGNKLNNNLTNLEWCDNHENIIHSYRTGIRKPTCHVGELNNKSKLSEAKVKEILASDDSVSCLAKHFNVSKSTIYKIKQRIRWSHL